MENNMSLIGKKYKPTDNSYARRTGYGEQTYNVAGKLYTILTEPFESKVINIVNREKVQQFILVQDQDKYTYVVLFNEKNIVTIPKAPIPALIRVYHKLTSTEAWEQFILSESYNPDYEYVVINEYLEQNRCSAAVIYKTYPKNVYHYI